MTRCATKSSSSTRDRSSATSAEYGRLAAIADDAADAGRQRGGVELGVDDDGLELGGAEVVEDAPPDTAQAADDHRPVHGISLGVNVYDDYIPFRRATEPSAWLRRAAKQNP